jgi:steroid delta-isomerase-like uncharacterized protein
MAAHSATRTGVPGRETIQRQPGAVSNVRWYTAPSSSSVRRARPRWLDMSPDENKAIVRRYFVALDERRMDDVAAVFAPDLELHFDGWPVMGKEAGLIFLTGYLDAFPGISHEVIDQVAEDDRVATRITVRGTHKADFMGLPATGKEIEIGAINMARMAGGAIVELWVNADSLGMMQQLGAIPTPG